MDETIYVILKALLDFALEMWFSILPRSSFTSNSLDLTVATPFGMILQICLGQICFLEKKTLKKMFFGKLLKPKSLFLLDMFVSGRLRHVLLDSCYALRDDYYKTVAGHSWWYFDSPMQQIAFNSHFL